MKSQVNYYFAKVHKAISGCLILLGLFSCVSTNQKYVNHAVKLMKKYSINRTEIDWKDFKSNISKEAADDETLTDAHHTIAYGLKMLNDQHSFFLTPDQLKDINSKDFKFGEITDSLIDNKFAYIKIPAFLGNKSNTTIFASHIQGLIAHYKQIHVSGWIIDLSENFGGNMWPMLLGLNGLLGDGTHGNFIDPNGKSVEPWGISGKSVFQGGQTMLNLPLGTPPFKSPDKIALLLSETTGSSGEAIALAISQIENCRTFGTPTAGATTCNRTFELKDHAEMLLTVSYFADKKNVIQYGPIVPQVSSSRNQSLMLAVQWLLN